MECPRCRRRLAQEESAAGPALGCDGCGHLLLEAPRLDELAGRVERRYRTEDVAAVAGECEARKRAALERPVVYCDCPACGSRMLRRTFGERSFLLVHFCAAHGHWVHRDELAGIVSYLERGGEVIELRHRIERLEARGRDLEGDVRRAEDRAAASQGGVTFLFWPGG